MNTNMNSLLVLAFLYYLFNLIFIFLLIFSSNKVAFFKKKIEYNKQNCYEELINESKICPWKRSAWMYKIQFKIWNGYKISKLYSLFVRIVNCEIKHTKLFSNELLFYIDNKIIWIKNTVKDNLNWEICLRNKLISQEINLFFEKYTNIIKKKF
jgi:hypothetical protein